MAKFVQATLAIVFLVAGLAPINAQTATQPSPSGVSQQEFQNTVKHLKSQIRHNDRKIDKAEKRMNGIEYTSEREGVEILNNADHQDEQDRKLAHTAGKVQDLQSRLTRSVVVIAVVLALAIIGGVLIVLRSRKGQSAMEKVLLPMNATATQVRAYAEAKGKIGGTLPYLYEIRDPDPTEPYNPEKKIIRAVVEGTVHHAGEGGEYYQFGGHKAKAPKRHMAAITYYEDLQMSKSHAINA